MRHAIWLIVLCVFASGAFAQQKPNVLFIIADDLCADLGCYGAPVKSPNIDALAAKSMRFERAYCQYPLCGPSRCSFMSGLRPDTTGVIQNGLPVRHKLKDVVTLPQLFRHNGYVAARIGKIYHMDIPQGVGRPGPDDPQSWDTTFNPPGAEFDTDGDEVIPNVKDGQGFRYVMGKGDGHEQHDYEAANEAIRLLNLHKDRPFFIALGFIRPHVPEIAPKSFFDLYPIGDIKLPEIPANDRDDIPTIALGANVKFDRGMTEQQCRESIRAYRATTSFMDAQAGRVLDQLHKLGLDDKTIVVFIGDHGYCLGQHHCWQKYLLFEPAARVPMMIRAPGMSPGVTRSLVESVDLYPTLASLAGLTPPQSLQGLSLVPVLKDASATVKAAAFTQVNRAKGEGRSVRTDRFRYTEWKGNENAAELYDEQNDPGEFTNLANDAQHAGDVESLRKLLKTDAIAK
jgi:uncharacterized sulfatase